MINKINKTLKDSMPLAEAIGMEIVSVNTETGECVAQMHVDERNQQPYGFLSGGAILAMGETLAGVASLALNPQIIPVGMNINANHIHSAAVGDTVTATTKPIHVGKKTHVWQVEVKDGSNRLVSVISVTNFIM